MNVEGIYRGTIKKLTNIAWKGTSAVGSIDTEDEDYKKNAILIKVSEDGYVDFDSLNFFADYRVRRMLNKNGIGFKLGGIILSTFCFKKGDLFVDRASLEEVNDFQFDSNEIPAKQLKKVIEFKNNND